MTIPIFRSDQDSYLRDDGMTIISRAAFVRDYFDYKPGQHVVFGGPSTHGKTTLACQLLQYQISPEFMAFLAASKPQDDVTEEWAERLRLRRVDDWPPERRLSEMLGGEKPNGYLVWIRFGDLHTDMQRCAEVTSKLLMERYAHGATRKNKGGILLMDDTMVKAKIMGLDSQMVTILAMAGAMKLGLWIFVQKPTDSGRTTTWGYEMASHLFFTRGGDARMLQRYIEIIGENGPIAKRVIPTLERYQFLYVNKITGHMCIVGAGE